MASSSSTLSVQSLPKQLFRSNSSISSSSQSNLFLRPSKPQLNPNLRVSLAPPLRPTPNNPSPSTLLSDSTLGLSVSKLLAQALHGVSKRFCTTPSQEDLAAIQHLQQSLALSMGPLFFAAINDRGPLNTPLTVVASGMAKWLEIYSGVLLVRVLLSWFPNIPWDRQPLSAIRDLCDPYLNLFRNVIPPLFDTLDVSPLLAFAVLGTFGGILNHKY